MANNLTIATVSDPPLRLSADLSRSEMVDAMIAHWRGRLETVLPDQPDLILLPEHCDRPAVDGLDPRKSQLDFLRYRGDVIRDFFSDVAKCNRTYIAYSAYRKASDGAYNSTQILDRDGSVVGAYDKNFLTIDESSASHLSYGTTLRTFDLDFGRVSAIICFDLNFEELRRQCEADSPDLILFSSAYHGGLMQSYWAYSCGSYFASAVYPPAPSGVTSPLGEVVATTTNYRNEVVATINLDCAVLHLDYNREKFPALKNRYGRGVRIHDPGRIGSVLVSAEADDVTIGDVMDEFEFELLPDYLARARAHRDLHV